MSVLASLGDGTPDWLEIKVVKVVILLNSTNAPERTFAARALEFDAACRAVRRLSQRRNERMISRATVADWPSIRGVIPLYRVSPTAIDYVRLAYGPYWPTHYHVEQWLRDDGFLVGDRNHWVSPELANIAEPNRDPSEYGPNHWHTDTADGKSKGDAVVVMVASDEPHAGTVISGRLDLLPYRERFRLVPWTVYALAGDIVHRAPTNRTLPCICFRWYQSNFASEIADRVAIGYRDGNTRRDEDGKLIWEAGK